MSVCTRIALAVGLLAAASVPGMAQQDTPAYKLLTTIKVPGVPLVKFDISYVNPNTNLYFLADRSNAGVDVFDAIQNRFLFRVPGFVGAQSSNDISGPDGLISIGPDQVWVGDGDSTVKVVDLGTRRVVSEIPTGGVKRADEMAWDFKDGILVVANDADTPPFVTFISTKTRQVLGQVKFTYATGGIEQTAYDPTDGLFYIDLPQVGKNTATGAVAVVDPRTMTVLRLIFVTNCTPTGNALGPRQNLLLGCTDTSGTQVLNLTTRKVVATLRQITGSDEVWFNPADHNYYLAADTNPTATGGPVLGIVDALDNKLVAKIPTAAGAHSVAADSFNSHVFVPLPAEASNTVCPTGCIGVYGVPFPAAPAWMQVSQQQ